MFSGTPTACAPNGRQGPGPRLPPNTRPCSENLAEASGRRQPPTAGARQPSDRMIGRRTEISEVQDNVLNARLGRQTGRVPSVVRIGTDVDNRTVDGGDSSSNRHGHMNEASGRIDESGNFGRGVVAEHGAITGGQQRRPHDRDARKRSAKRCIAAAMKMLPDTAMQVRPSHPGRHSRRQRLRTADDSALPSSHSGD